MVTVRDELVDLPTDAILAALDEFDELGEEAFLDKYGYKPAYRWKVETRGRLYPPRAISAAAYCNVHGRIPSPEEGPRKLMPKHLRRIFDKPGMKVSDHHPIKSVQSWAVDKALDEYDRIGRAAFLDKYGYYEAREYYVVRVVSGERRYYDSKPILGAAYGYQHPTNGPLGPREFSGGLQVTLPVLEGLGFDTVSALPGESELTVATLKPGQVFAKRGDIHAALGGQTQGGISTPKGKPYILLFTGPSGEQYGYYDGWDGDAFLYAGEGPIGDMSFVRGNRAVRDHIKNGKALLLFQETKNGGRRFEGTFVCQGYEMIRGLDVNGMDRDVIQFHLALEAGADSHKASKETARPRGGQGRVQSAAERKAIEMYAVHLAQDHYEAEGWTVVEKGKPYDLHCSRDTEVLYVEVKGTKSAGSMVTLTRNEVEHMRIHWPATALYVVSGVEVSEEEGDFFVEGGSAREINPWLIEDDDLRATEFSYAVPEAE